MVTYIIPPRPDPHHSVTEDEALLLLALCRAIKAKLVVEIGTYMSYSASVMTQSGASVYTYDLHPQPSRFTGYHQINGTSHMVREKEIDLAFIDGDHSYAWCKIDVENILPRMRSGGLLVMHDTMGSHKDGPGRVANMLVLERSLQRIDLPTGPGKGVSGLTILKVP